MVILYVYLRENGNIISYIPLRYNNEVETIEPRELILDIAPDATYDSIKQQVLNIIDKEKQEDGKLNSGYSGDMSGVITIE